MTNTCKIDGQIEEVRRLISECKNDSSRLETRLTELLEEKNKLTENPIVTQIKNLLEYYDPYYRNPEVKEKDWESITVKYTTKDGDPILGSGLASNLHSDGLYVTKIETHDGKTTLSLRKAR